MTTDFPATGKPAIDNWPLTTKWVNDQFFADNPQCQAFIRPVFPNEVPLYDAVDEVWLVVVRRGQPDPMFAQIQTRLSAEQVLRDKESMAELVTAYCEELKIPTPVYILDCQMKVISC
jgi:hypothetical protein